MLEVRHRVAIAGRVIDVGAGKPIGGAAVDITQMPAAFERVLAAKAMQYGSRWNAMAPRPDRTRSAADGLFYFLDLPDGKYTISASLTGAGRRYGATRQTTTVSRDASGNVKFAFLEVGLQPTTVQGKVTGSGRKAGVVMAEVRVKGSGERAFSNAKGEYLLAGVEPGKRTILVVAQGYGPASQAVTIGQAGDVATLNFALVDANGEGGPSQRGK